MRAIHLLNLLVVFGLCLSTSCWAIPQGTTCVAVDEDPVAPHELQLVRVDDYIITVDDLALGQLLVEQGRYRAFLVNNFDLANYTARTQGTMLTFTNIAGKPTYQDTNGDLPDFFLFAVGIGQSDSIGVQAILSGGRTDDRAGQAITIGGSVFADTGLDTPDGNDILSVAFSVTDLLDHNGQALTNDTLIEGLQVEDPALVLQPSCMCAAVVKAKISVITPANETQGLTEFIDLQWQTQVASGYVETYRIFLDPNREAVIEPAAQALLINGQAIEAQLLQQPNLGSTVWNGPTTYDTWYYWRVEATVVDPCDPNGPFEVRGPLWSFAGIPTAAFVSAPNNIVVLPDLQTGQAETDCVFTAEIDAYFPVVSVEWYRLSDPNTPLTEGAKYHIEYSNTQSTLTVYDANSSDNGGYYCAVTLDTGRTSTSPPGSLEVRYILRHRWSFNDGTAKDTGNLGGAHGIIVDPCDQDIRIEDGQAIFEPGLIGGHNFRSDSPFVHYIDLPNGIISALGKNNATFMVWFTPEDDETNENWERIFEFGGPVTLEEDAICMWEVDRQPEVKTIYLTPQSGQRDILFHSPQSGNLIRQGAAKLFEEIMVAVSYSDAENKVTMYVNGTSVDDMKIVLSYDFADLPDLNNWLGRGQYDHDPTFIGKINELRIYDVPLSKEWIRQCQLLGPDELPTEPYEGTWEEGGDDGDDGDITPPGRRRR